MEYKQSHSGDWSFRERVKSKVLGKATQRGARRKEKVRLF